MGYTVCQSLRLAASATVRSSRRFVGWAEKLTTEPTATLGWMAASEL
jgi:hypothetical protein